MNNFDKIREETATMEGMAEMFISSDWEGKGHYFSEHTAQYFDSKEDAIQAEIKWFQQENKIETNSCMGIKLKDIKEYMAGDFTVEVEDATNDEYNHIDDFLSKDIEKMELYKNAQVTGIMPFNNSCVQINVCINCS